MALLAPSAAGAQTAGTSETVLSNIPASGTTSSAGNCSGQALGFTTGSDAATLEQVAVLSNSAATDAEIREHDAGSGNPKTAALYSLTYSSGPTGGRVTFTAPESATLDASTQYWLVLPVGTSGTCRSRPLSDGFSTLHGWSSSGSNRWWNNSRWNTNTGGAVFEIVASVHTGDPHQPPVVPDAGPREPQPVTPKPFCNSSGRDPSGGTECYWESYDQIPVSDPCDQPWQVRGSYRPGRGCLNRY